MKFVILCGVLFLMSGCVFPGDIARLQMESNTLSETYRLKFDELKEADVDRRSEILDELEEAEDKYNEGIAEVAAEVGKRTDEAIAMIKAVKDGSITLGEGIAGGGTGLAALFGLIQAVRNKKYRVLPQTPQPPAPSA